MHKNQQDDHHVHSLKLVNGIQTDCHDEFSHNEEHLFRPVVHHLSSYKGRNDLKNSQESDDHVSQLLILICYL